MRSVVDNLDRRGSWALRDASCQSSGTHIYTWGRGDMGQLGSGRHEDIFYPQQPEALYNRQIVYATANLFNTIFVLGMTTAFSQLGD